MITNLNDYRNHIKEAHKFDVLTQNIKEAVYDEFACKEGDYTEEDIVKALFALAPDAAFEELQDTAKVLYGSLKTAVCQENTTDANTAVVENKVNEGNSQDLEKELTYVIDRFKTKMDPEEIFDVLDLLANRMKNEF